MTEATFIAQRLDEILDTPAIGDLVGKYFDPRVSSPFAGSLFDTLGENDPEAFGIADMLALNLLDERVGAVAMRKILDGLADLQLAAVPADRDLWDATDDDRAKANALRTQLLELRGLGPTNVAKLCARKRPRLIPIYDSVVARVLQIRGSWWQELGIALSDEKRRRSVESLGHGLPGEPTALRIVDVAIWMVGSNATTVRAARARVGVSAAPLF